MELLALPEYLLQRIDVAWTFLLLLVRFVGVFMTCPGLGMGMSGLPIRMPAALIFAFAALMSGSLAALPSNTLIACGMIISEVMFGSLIGFIPLLVISGIQMAGGLISTSMGLQASQLIDPTVQVALPDLARIFGDLTILIFISLGGHLAVVYAASGMGGLVTPGSFISSDKIIELLVNNTADIFKIGVLFSAPIIVALLVTNVVLGIISKAVPTVNVFMVSFPLTIAIGLVLSVLLISELQPFISPWLARMGATLEAVH